MKKSLLKRIFLTILIVSILSMGLTGCMGVDITVPLPETETGTVKITVYGDNKYDLKMDGDTVFSSKPQGTYTIPNVSIGNHKFEAINDWGSEWGYDSEEIYVIVGTNNVSLYPPDTQPY